MEFPALNEPALWDIALVLRLVRENAHVLDDAPYSVEIKSWFLRQLVVVPGSAEIGDLETEARALFQQMKTLSGEIAASNDVKEKIAILKVGAQLLEKLLILQERAADVKAYAKFQRDVIDILQEILNPEQRTLVMDRLKALTQ